MRRLVLAQLIACATGCNWAFGLSATQTWDAGDAAPDSPPGIRTKLVWGAVTTDGMGEPDATITYAGIGSETTRPATPVVQVGPLDATLGELAAAPYDISDGSFEIPYNLRDAPHRIVYTLPGDPTPHEVQGAVTGATLVVPRYARMDAPLTPPNSGFTITPMGSTGFDDRKIYTSGVFNLNDVSDDMEAAGPSLTLRYSEKARPLSLPSGAIQGSKGDWVLATQWVTRSTGEFTVLAWTFARNIDLAPSTLSTPSPQPPMMTGQRTLGTGTCPGPSCWPVFNYSNASGRMTSLGPLVSATQLRRIRYGILASTELPPIMPGVAPEYLDSSTILYFLELTAPLVTVLLDDPSYELPEYPRAVWGRISSSRTANGATLTSSMSETVKDLQNGNVVRFLAPLAKSIMLGSTNLSGADDVVFPASSTQVTLSFTPDNSNAHDFLITVYELANNAITPVRVYHVTTPTAKIDASLLVTGHRYVLGITSRVGFPMASQGDYRTVTWPFANSTTMAATFVVQ